MSVTVTVAPHVTTVETIDEGADSADAAQRRVTHAAFNDTIQLTATSNPPATEHSGFVKSLVAGAATIDLTALTGVDNSTIDGTGLKVQLIRVKNLGANNLTISEGAANGYAIGGTRTVYANGGIEYIYAPEGLADIAAADRTIDLAGTGTQQSEWTIILG